MNYDLLAVFGAGLVSFVTPCVLPVIPVYLAALAGGDLRSLEGGRWLLVRRALLFCLGFILVFTVMGLGASSIGAFLARHRVAVQVVGALLVLVFALKFLGLLRIPALERVVKADDRRLLTRFAGVNALVMGVVFAAGWSPCVGPVLGSVLTFTAAAATHPLSGAGYLAAYGAGFALPLLVTAVFAEAGTAALRRLGPQLPRIEKGVGVLMLGVALFLGHGAVRDLGAADGADLAGDRLPRMVELYAKDCPVCQRMKPLMDELIEECDQRGVRVEAIDISLQENRHLAARYRVVGVPTFLFIDSDGLEVARLVGEQTEATLKQGLAALRGEECPGTGRLPAGLSTPLAFPDQEEKEADSCPPVSSDAKPLEPISNSFAAPQTANPLDAQSATSPPENCSLNVP